MRSRTARAALPRAGSSLQGTIGCPLPSLRFYGRLRLQKTRYSVKGMCGLAGIYAGADRAPARSLVLEMVGELRHRGPDGTGLLLDGRIGIAAARLAIVDLDGGDQPLSYGHGRLRGGRGGE